MPKRSSGYQTLPSGSVRWRVSVNGVRHTGTAPTLAEARIARAQAQVDAGGIPDDDPTVAELLDTHIINEARAGTTKGNWRWARDGLPEAFTERHVSEVTAPVVAALWRQLRNQGAPPHRIVKTFNLCSSAWSGALELGLVRINPFRQAKPPKPPLAPRIQPPTVDDVRTLVAAADDPAFALWLRLMARTGARGGEMCALTWSDVLVDRCSVRIGPSITRTGQVSPGKTALRGHRVVPLDLPTMTALRQHQRIVGCPWVFNRNGVDAWRPDGAAKRLVKLCAGTTIDVSPHDLRHFAVTQWLGDGWSVATVAELIGDSPRTVSQTYAHWIPEQGREAVERLGAKLDGAG